MMILFQLAQCQFKTRKKMKKSRSFTLLSRAIMKILIECMNRISQR